MLNLPPPDRTPLSNAALPLVVAQVRFDSAGMSLDQATLRRVQASLREHGLDCPQVNAVTGVDVLLGPGQQSQATTNVSGWQLAADDGQVQVTLMPDSAALETPAFRSYDDQFGPQFAAVLAAVNDTLAPVTTRRLGIRFVNVLKPPASQDADDWSKWIRPSLCAPLSDAGLAPGIDGIAHQLLLRVTTEIRSTVRAGVVDADGPAYLLDIDTFNEPAELWSHTDVARGFDELNSHGVAVFQALISYDMLNYLRTGSAQTEGAKR